MHKFARIAFAAFLFGVSLPSPAHAIAIGLLGGDVDPVLPFITDIGYYDLLPDNPGDPDDPCAFLAGTFFCAAYEVANDGDFPAVIDSIDFRMRKPTGELYSTAEIGLFTAHEASDLPFIGVSSLFDDGFTFALFDSDSLVCPPVGDPEFPSFCRGDFFSDDAAVAAVSVVGVNGAANPGAAAVPEPVSLLLVGAGLTGVLTRRRLARRRLPAANPQR